ncbi:manganese-dependent inorganic pyrophosphatase [Patescibacteria group bacterium]|nr:manganese-dependent inorganic pyrophosphatase [Patescibacteria group bacterium]
MNYKIIAIGHKNPDTDSVLSAILISRFAKKIFGFEIDAVVAGKINNETNYILEKLKLKKPRILKIIKKEAVILVDTTEPKQIIDGLMENNLLAIIDHHNFGGLKSSKPIFARVEALGCTGSVIYKILQERNIKVDKISATLIITCIISDTLNFNSPTTTADDKKIFRELNKIVKLDVKNFVNEIFTAKSNLKGISVDDIISKDYKQFDMGRIKVGIGVWETTSPETVNVQKDKIIQALLEKKSEEKMDYLFFAVVDIIKNNSDLYIVGQEEAELAKSVFSGNKKEGLIFLRGVVSRKKQLVPPLMDKLSRE